VIQTRHELQPIVVPAQLSHAEGFVRYAADGSVTFRHPALEALGLDAEVVVPPWAQHPLVFATFTDLSKALSSSANSPLLESGRSLREEFDLEFTRYRQLCDDCEQRGGWEPDYGSYVYDHVARRLYLIAPERWHRIALTTSTGTLLRDPEGKLHYRQVRAVLEAANIGVVGVSVGSNVVEALARELRPRSMKLADPDWIELNNLNRLERGDLAGLVQPRSARSDLRCALEMHRYNKAAVIAYAQQRVDPYADYFVYPEGLDSSNLDRFLLGEGDEPRLDLVVEEADDIAIKVAVRRRCRELGIPVLMLTDFGHQAILHFQDFKREPTLPLAFACSDTECDRLFERALTTGNRDDLFAFVRAFLGPDCIRAEFAAWVNGEGERPTSSLPQSGATALISGGLAGKTAALYLLGHAIPRRAIYDFSAHTLDCDR
jgi:molybdopterin/thiamine biosynthesis adenylyltransferase